MTAKPAIRRRRGGGPRALAQSLAAVTRPLFGKRGFADGAVLTDWPVIAGQHLARHSLPEKVTPGAKDGGGGTLHLRIENGSIATELQHLEPLLVERINGYFGFKAVARLKIIQGPLPPPPEDPPPAIRPPATGDETDLAQSLMDVDDPALRAALADLGRAVIGRRRG